MQIPYSPWLEPLLAAVILLNLASVALRAHATGRWLGFALVTVGALAIVAARGGHWYGAAAVGAGLTMAGSLVSALGQDIGVGAAAMRAIARPSRYSRSRA